MGCQLWNKKGGAKTNIVFWILVIATLVLAWLSMSPFFERIGQFFMELFNDAKDGALNDNKNEEE